ncbi:MAG: hypothetical protein H8E31_08495 [Planctomycetes bacterium]|nr:hypothetical protein [Planctomycetota bacterium]
MGAKFTWWAALLLALSGAALAQDPGDPPAAETRFPSYLYKSDWNEMTREIWTQCQSGSFEIEDLLQGMRSDNPKVRANALLAWYSPTVLRQYWWKPREKRVDAYAPFDLVSDQDTDVWDVVLSHFLDDSWRMNLEAAKRASRSRPAVTRRFMEQALHESDSQLLREVVWAFLEENYNEFRPELIGLVFGQLSEFSGNRPALRLSGNQYRGMYSTNYQEWLVHHGEALHDELMAWLLGEDPERRAIAAYVFARRRWGGHDALVCNSLIDHLASDDREGNAFLAANALLQLGDRALDPLRAALGLHGEQADTFLELLIMDITDPPASPEELRRRKLVLPGLREICPTCFDPLLEHRGPDYYLAQRLFCLEREVTRQLNLGYHSCSTSETPWVLEASECPCKSHLCGTKIRELAEPRAEPPIFCMNQDLELMARVFPEIDLDALAEQWPEALEGQLEED